MPADRPTTADGDPLTADAIVSAIRAAPQPVVNTRYLAGEFGTEPEELVAYLSTLVEEGVLESLEIRGRTRLWWLSLESELDSDRR